MARGPMQLHRLHRLKAGPAHCYKGKNGKAINLCKVENDDIDVLKTRSIKNSKSLLEYPCVVAALVAAFDAKTFKYMELLKS